MSDIEKITNNVFKVTIGRPPRQIPVSPHYRGDMFSLTIIGVNQDDTPFDFDGLERAVMQFRVNPRGGNVVAEFTMDAGDIILGKTDSSQPEYDELHIYDPAGTKLKTNFKTLHADLELIIHGDKLTPVYFLQPIIYDVTRVES